MTEERTIRVGEDVVLELAERPTTGFRWAVEVEPPEAFELVEDVFVPPDPGRPGAGGHRILRWRAVAAGEVVVWGRQRRRWEAAAAEPSQRLLRVRVLPA